MILVKLLLCNTFIKGKYFWVELEKSNDVFQRIPFRIPIFPILFTPVWDVISWFYQIVFIETSEKIVSNRNIFCNSSGSTYT